MRLIKNGALQCMKSGGNKMFEYEINGESVEVIELGTKKFIARVKSLDGQYYTSKESISAAGAAGSLTRKLIKKGLPGRLSRVYDSKVLESNLRSGILDNYSEYAFEIANNKAAHLSFRERMAIGADAIEVVSKSYRISELITLEKYIEEHVALTLFLYELEKETSFAIIEKGNIHLTESEKEDIFRRFETIKETIRYIGKIKLTEHLSDVEFHDAFTTGIVKSMIKFEKGAGSKIGPYVLQGIDFLMRTTARHRYTHNLHVKTIKQPGMQATESSRNDTESDFIQSEEIRNVEKILNSGVKNGGLKEEAAISLKMYYGIGSEPVTQDEIAEVTGISQSRVSKGIKTAIQYLAIRKDKI